jgi:hypothetical protein
MIWEFDCSLFTCMRLITNQAVYTCGRNAVMAHHIPLISIVLSLLSPSNSVSFHIQLLPACPISLLSHECVLVTYGS